MSYLPAHELDGIGEEAQYLIFFVREAFAFGMDPFLANTALHHL